MSNLHTHIEWVPEDNLIKVYQEMVREHNGGIETINVSHGKIVGNGQIGVHQELIREHNGGTETLNLGFIAARDPRFYNSMFFSSL